MRTVVTALILLTILAVAAGAAFGCIGARPLAMGGAFIGLADDANATYWNPAGLAQMPVGQMLGTWTHTADNRDQVNYQEFGSLSSSWATSRWFKKMAIGASYIDSDTNMRLGINSYADEQTWYWGSLAVDAGKLGMFGINVRDVRSSVEGHSVDSELAIDAGYLYKVTPQLSVGVLAQNANEPYVKFDDVKAYNHFLNWRAGVAYRPMSGTVVTIDGYDMADNGSQRSARFGVEKVLRNFTLRAGYYGLGSDLESGTTVGIGISKQLYEIDAALLMGDFDNTLMISAGFNLL